MPEKLQDGRTGPRFVNEPYGVPFTQAGAHPWALTTRFSFNTETITSPGAEPAAVPTRDVKDIETTLPPGLLGDPLATPQCPLTLATNGEALCPADTQIGVYRSRMEGTHELVGEIVNLAAEPGESAEFALESSEKITQPLLTAHLVHTPAHMTREGVQIPGSYSFTVVSDNLPLISINEVELTFWGVPADPSHDAMRGKFCTRPELNEILVCEGGNRPSGVAPVPFLTLPTDCAAGPGIMTLRVDSWQEPGKVEDGEYSGFAEAEAALPAATGCEALGFGPSLSVAPETTVADEPVGLGIDLNVPLTETPQSNATPQLRNTFVTLPVGMSVSPGVVDGIQACEEFGPKGINITGPESEEVALSGELQLAPGHCPNASTVGTAEAVTPFLPEPVKGHLYLARPACGGSGQSACTEEDARDGHLYKLYLELGGSGELATTGIHFKVPFEVEANLATGQLTSRTLGTPQAPFSDLKIHLNGGPRAPMDTPATCGPAVTTSDFVPWSAPGQTPEGLIVGGTPAALSTSFFDVTGCQSAPGLTPGFVAGTVSPQAGKYSQFTVNVSRQDREQYVRGVQVHTPSGLLGVLANVPLCEEPQANAGTCPQSSKIGTTRVASGAGSHPFEIEGEVFLTGPHDGAPFGLSIVTHVVAGPFNLGVVVVRAAIEVNRQTATLTVTTDEDGPHAIPRIVFGVPLRLKQITVDIDRPGFMINPTNCAAEAITADISGFEGAVAHVSSPFAAAGCTSLAFKPKFTVSTSAHTSRADGADLDVKLSYPAGSLGNEANIKSVKVELPKQLPARLTTLQKACPAATFEANPADCPSASIVGVVRATTPLLAVGLSGPVYFVSHGGEAFPSLIVVLQGDGVRVDLTGSTFISKQGITSSTFKTVPDVPVGTFELYLPEGRFSALAADGELCSRNLVMPTEFVAQNGATLKQATKIAVTGCAATAAAKKRKPKKGHGKVKKSSRGGH